MAEHHLHRAQVGAALEEVRREADEARRRDRRELAGLLGSVAKRLVAGTEDSPAGSGPTGESGQASREGESRSGASTPVPPPSSMSAGADSGSSPTTTPGTAEPPRLGRE